jgi:NAD+-dependent secondary alcohol dehydrogenase Adh1
MLVRGGTYSIVGFGGTVTVPSVAMVGNENTIVGNLVGSWIDLWEVLQLHARGRLTLKTERHSLDDVNDVLAKLREGEVTGRAVLVPDSSNGRERA